MNCCLLRGKDLHKTTITSSSNERISPVISMMSIAEEMKRMGRTRMRTTEVILDLLTARSSQEQQFYTIP
jgi:hypothetical protein